MKRTIRRKTVRILVRQLKMAFTTIISLSYLQADAIKEAAEQNPKLNFALIDGEISNEKNIVSATFKDQESAYLAGLAAAYSTKRIMLVLLVEWKVQ